MRRLIPIFALPIALLACGSASPQPVARDSRERACSRIELNRVEAPVSGGGATVDWEVASTVDVRGFLVEQKLTDGRWKRSASAPASARSVRLSGLAAGPAEFRIWAELKQMSGRARRGALLAAAAHERARVRAASAADSLAVGLNAGYWGACEPPELSTAIKYVRLDTPSSIAPWTSVGLNVIADESGPYDRGGVAAFDTSAYVKRVVAFVQANPHVWAIEVLNEPGNAFFWGKGAEAEANRSAYANLIVAVHDALAARFGAKRPLIFASYDGGDSSNAWGEAWTQNTTALADADMLTEHPYGLGTQRSSAALGNRAEVEAAHAKTGKPIAITEVGWPTNGATVESGPVEYSEAEQANNIGAFVYWARQTGYVKSLTIYNYRDTGEGGGFGVQTHAGAKKRSWFALIQAARLAEG
jgi:hypothetical protein